MRGMDYQEWEEERIRGMEDKRAVAEVRRREAEVKLARDNWMQERLRKAEIERRESVKLMEMLRTAKMMRKPKITQVVEVGAGAWSEADADKCMANTNDDVEDCPENRVEDHEVSRKRRIIKSSNRPSALAVEDHPVPASVPGHCGERRGGEEDKVDSDGVVGMRRKEDRTAELEREKKALEMRRREGHRQLSKLVSPLGQLDSTEEVSCLSTIMEESEMISPTMTDSVDLATGRGRIRAEGSKESSVSPFMETNIERRKLVEKDLSSVKEVMARVKMQGKVLEKAETHFMTVEGSPGGQASKLPVTAKPYKIDQQFVKRVLEFSSSSFLSSSSLSSSNSSKATKQPNIVPTSHPASLQPHKSHPKQKYSSHHHKASHPPAKAPKPPKKASLPPPHTPQPHLRYYIEKLLSLRQEDVQNLSVSSSTPDRQMESQRQKKTVTSSSLSQSSASCRVEESQAILSLYQSTRQQLLHKLSGVTAGHSTGQQLDWSSFDLSSGGEGGDVSAGTLSSISLSNME